jgi:hypothetical protein
MKNLLNFIFDIILQKENMRYQIKKYENHENYELLLIIINYY